MTVNAPESGTIKEFLVNEEDTVTVGQDLVKLEPGTAPAAGQEKESSKETKKSEQPPPAEEPAEKKPEPTPAPSTPKQEAQQPPTPKPVPEKPTESAQPPQSGNRDERRACNLSFCYARSN